MKRYFILLTISLSVVLANAQNIDKIKASLMLNQYETAKTDIDKAMTNAKFSAKSEAYILKTAIYAGLAMSDSKKGTPEGDQLTKDANDAFNKYKEMDPALELMSDPIYQNGPINLYSSYYTAGYQNYTKKNWADALTNLKKAIVFSDLLISKKLLNSSLDTNVLILAGITAESAGDKEETAVFYTKLADAKVGGEGFEGVYRFLVSYSFGHKDMAAFEKYKAYGKELFPKSEYFDYDKIDFAVGLLDNFEGKLKALEEVLATDPDSYKANQVLGEIIYDTLNPKDDEPVALPANAEELENKMVSAFNKAAIANKGNKGEEISYLYIGDHFINKASSVNLKREAHTKDMKARTKPGTMASKDDIAKRDALDKEYSDVLDGAREPYEAAAAIYAAKTELDQRDKQQYKKVTGYLSDIYANKRVRAKGKPAEQAKYKAEEDKWNDRYDSIK